MEKLLIGTTNSSKKEWFRRLLQGHGVEFLTLEELGVTEEPEETGRTPAENAALKAEFYGKYWDTAVCNDSGLYLDCLPLEDPRQPGLRIRRPGDHRPGQFPGGGLRLLPHFRTGPCGQRAGARRPGTPMAAEYPQLQEVSQLRADPGQH